MGGGRGGIGRPVEKPKDFKKTWGKLIAYSRTERLPIIASFLGASAGAILSLIGPRRLAMVVDVIEKGMTGSIDFRAMRLLIAGLIAIYGTGALLNYFQNFFMTGVAQTISKRMRRHVAEKINKVPINYFNRVSYGDILSRVTNDVDGVSQALNQGIASIGSSVTLFFGSLAMMIIANVWMALAAVGVTLIGFFFMTLTIRASRKYFVAQQRDLGDMNGHVEEIYAGHNIVRAYNGEKGARKTFDKINDRLKTSAFKSQALSSMMMPMMFFMGNLGFVTVSIMGGIFVFQGRIPFSTIVAFMMYIRLFSHPLQDFAQVATRLQSAAAASERVFEFLEEEEVEDESGKTQHLDQVRGQLEFRNVRFRYEGMEEDVIHDFTAWAKPGQKIAIVGPTGAGKTTMVNLLMRFYEIEHGLITIDGINIQDLTRENVREQFCMVLQDTWLFEGTIRENIVYSKENVSDGEVIRACEAVGLHHFIETLPYGYDTVLGDETNLSAGQKQQITIARAMIENAPMLILDEATSSIDTRTELNIQRALDQLMGGRTSIIIAHRLSTIKNADVILVMQEGNIIERGSHDELMALNGFYAGLYNSQFETAA
ncbi:MAG TPA: ABC transporter ATP-binding protein [Bacillota bacterium]|jgi:ATP-binding cassette subfamily B multidrug efflux pump|nr:ABC transporter ATP-binding protein [Fastidiosipila sp.]HPX93744.1 ABC transporter ATP-binding protein [Bacillota bacterium]HQB81585.1 ABC transporter ATP-binding protein [Bacillota bacterium]